MRLAIALLAAALTLSFVPLAAASHCCGPCTHEWVETVLHVPGDYKEGGFRQALGNAGERAGGCLDNAVRWACETTRCDEIVVICYPCMIDVSLP